VGPSIRIDADGQLTATRELVMTVPIGAWIHVEILAALGKQAKGMYQLTVTVPGQAPKKFDALPVGNPDWHSLRWLGFISVADAKTAIYLDDVRLNLE
jgi:hypothetical protein